MKTGRSVKIDCMKYIFQTSKVWHWNQLYESVPKVKDKGSVEFTSSAGRNLNSFQYCSFELTDKV